MSLAEGYEAQSEIVVASPEEEPVFWVHRRCTNALGEAIQWPHFVRGARLIAADAVVGFRFSFSHDVPTVISSTPEFRGN
jgi:hypothetical protein